jgi:hypothetical protein
LVALKKQPARKSKKGLDPEVDDRTENCKRFYFGGLSITEEDAEPHPDGGRCLRCGYTCANARTMENHVNKVHKNSYPYDCQECGKKFASKESCTRHYVFIHEGRWTPSKIKRKQGLIKSKPVKRAKGVSKYKADGTREFKPRVDS